MGWFSSDDNNDTPAPAPAPYVPPAVSTVITEQFQSLLGRSPTSEEINQYAPLYQNNGDGASIATAIRGTPEYLNTKTPPVKVGDQVNSDGSVVPVYRNYAGQLINSSDWRTAQPVNQSNQKITIPTSDYSKTTNINPGVNPGYIGATVAPQYSNPNAPLADQFNWTPRAGIQTADQLANYNKVSGTTGYGVGSSAVGGTEHLNIPAFTQQYLSPANQTMAYGSATNPNMAINLSQSVPQNNIQASGIQPAQYNWGQQAPIGQQQPVQQQPVQQPTQTSLLQPPVKQSGVDISQMEPMYQTLNGGKTAYYDSKSGMIYDSAGQMITSGSYTSANPNAPIPTTAYLETNQANGTQMYYDPTSGNWFNTTGGMAIPANGSWNQGALYNPNTPIAPIAPTMPTGKPNVSSSVTYANPADAPVGFAK